MKQISIKSMLLANFKGIQNLNIDFSSQTQILGANGTGKTTIFDAFTWLLFGKDSTDRKDFNIKNTVETDLNRKEHEVTAIVLVDGVEVILKRVYKEKWQKTRGSEEQEFKGNETEFYYNEVPCSQTEYNAKINSILPETVFKMLTSPTFFNSDSTSWTWKNRREILTKMAGEFTDIDLINEMMNDKNKSQLDALINAINQGKNIDEYKAQIANSVKKAKEDLKGIPTRIDEVLKGMPEKEDFTSLEKELETTKTELDSVDKQISDVQLAFQSKLDAVKAEKVKINNLESEIQTIETNASKEAKERIAPDNSKLTKLVAEKDDKSRELQGYQNGLATLEAKKSTLESKLSGIKNRIQVVETERTEKRNLFNKINAEEFNFDNSTSCCPTCKRDFEPETIEAKKTEVLENFRKDQTARLERVRTDGHALKNEQEGLEAEVKSVEAEITSNNERISNGKTAIETAKKELQTIIDNIDLENSNLSQNSDEQSFDVLYKSILDLDTNYQDKLIMLEGMKASLVEEPTTDNSELNAKRTELNSKIDNIKAQLLTKTEIEKAESRITELKTEEKKLSQQVADVEKLEFAIQGFEKFKSDKTEEAVNSKFKMVKFRMFETQINGGLKATCEALVNGVPFSDANTASKINAGVDVINTLSEFYECNAPIFIDNRESVTQIIDTESQLISLVVSPKNKKLLVETSELVMAN
jgi:DNA repair exonuclease SbcCD ATPase subunit